MEMNRNAVVVDTSVVSLIFRSDSRARYYRAQLASRHPFISFQTFEELWHGAAYGGWGKPRKQDLRQHLERYVLVWPDEEMARISAELRAKRKRQGNEMDAADAWIAATAIALGCPLVSDDRDFVGIENLDLIRAPGSPDRLPPGLPGRPGAG